LRDPKWDEKVIGSRSMQPLGFSIYRGRIMNELKIVTPNEVFGLIGISGVVFTIIDKLQAPVWASFGFTLIILCLSLIFIVRAKSLEEEKRTRKNRFDEGRDKGGASCLTDIKEAEESILLTHFSRETPDPTYLKEIQSKIDDQVYVARIVTSRSISDPSDYDWLNEIIRGKCYVQYVSQYDLPFNLIIIDKKIVWMFFPTESDACHFNKAISFKSELLASCFKRPLA
jgi:hypothetical protein